MAFTSDVYSLLPYGIQSTPIPIEACKPTAEVCTYFIVFMNSLDGSKRQILQEGTIGQSVTLR